MQRYATAIVGIVLLLVCAAAGAGAQADKTPAASPSPEEVVTRYLEALKAGNFAARSEDDKEEE